jgi:two-component system, NtrC family, sensor kinase
VSDDFFDDLEGLTPAAETANLDQHAGVEAGLTKLAALVEDLNRDLTGDSVLDRAMDAAIELTGAERGFLVLGDEHDTGAWVFRVARSMESGNIENAEAAASRTILRKVIEGRAPILINDVVGASDLTKQQSIARMQVRSIMGAPLISKGKLLGAAYVDTSKLAGVFDQTSLVLFTSFVQLAAVALENARLIEAEQVASARSRDAQEYLETVLRSQPHGVAILDKSLHVEYANPQAAKLLNGSPLLRGTHFADSHRCPPEAMLSMVADLEAFVRSETQRRAVVDIDGNAVAYSFFNLHQHSDGQRRVGIVLEDITAQKQLEKKLIESEKRSTVNQLAGGIAHEINNSLSPVKGRVELLQLKLKRDGIITTDGLERDLETIGSLTARIEKIVRNLRHLTRPATPEFEELDLRLLLLATVDMMESTTGKLRGFSASDPNSEFRLKLEIADHLPPILGERHGLESAFINLIINATHALHEKGHGTLSIGARAEGDSVVAWVKDTGVGIRPEVLPRVFEPYFTTKDDGGGTGLGMCIVQNIAEIHSAKLALDSTYGKGTRITITFPALKPVVSD